MAMANVSRKQFAVIMSALVRHRDWGILGRLFLFLFFGSCLGDLLLFFHGGGRSFFYLGSLSFFLVRNVSSLFDVISLVKTSRDVVPYSGKRYTWFLSNCLRNRRDPT